MLHQPAPYQSTAKVECGAAIQLQTQRSLQSYFIGATQHTFALATRVALAQDWSSSCQSQRPEQVRKQPSQETSLGLPWPARSLGKIHLWMGPMLLSNLICDKYSSNTFVQQVEQHNCLDTMWAREDHVRKSVRSTYKPSVESFHFARAHVRQQEVSQVAIAYTCCSA